MNYRLIGAAVAALWLIAGPSAATPGNRSAPESAAEAGSRDFDIGLTALKRDDFAVAIEAFTRVLATPGIPAGRRFGALVNRSMAWSRSREQAKALADIEAAIALRPRDPNALVTRANIEDDGGDPASALADYDRALAIDPRFGVALYNRGIVFEHQGKDEAALAEIDKAEASGYRTGESLVRRARIEGRLKRWDAAIADADRAIAAGDHTDAHTLKALDLYIGKQNAAAAEVEAELAVAQNPGDLGARSIRSAIRDILGKSDGAVEDSDVVLAKRPNDSGVWKGRGQILLNAGRYHESADSLTRSLNLEPTGTYAVIQRHVARLRQGEGDQTEFEAALAKLKPDPWPSTLIAFFQGKIDERALLAAADKGAPAELAGQRCEADYYIGQTRMAAKDPAGARPHFERAAKACPFNFTEGAGARGELKRMGA